MSKLDMISNPSTEKSHEALKQAKKMEKENHAFLNMCRIGRKTIICASKKNIRRYIEACAKAY